MPPKERPVTITDVARSAGVSAGVVSSVLNGNRHPSVRVSPATQERIRKAALELQYRPNAVASALKSGRTQTILVACYFVESLITGNQFFAELLDGLLGRAVERGYDLTFHALRHSDQQKPGVLGDGRADGCIWVAPRVDDPVVHHLSALQYPLVALCTRLDGVDGCLLADNIHGAGLAVEHLVRLGHRRLLFAAERCREPGYDEAERMSGFLAACEQHGVTAEIADWSSLPAVFSTLDRPTGLVAWNDSVAATAIAMAREHGLSVPTDLSIIGFDSTPFCDRVSPPLTSVYQPVRQMAERAVDRLINQIHGESGSDRGLPGIELFPCRLDVRFSTAPPPGGAVPTPP